MKQPTKYDLEQARKALEAMEEASRLESHDVVRAAWDLWKHAYWMHNYLRSQLEENAR